MQEKNPGTHSIQTVDFKTVDWPQQIQKYVCTTGLVPRHPCWTLSGKITLRGSRTLTSRLFLAEILVRSIQNSPIFSDDPDIRRPILKLQLRVLGSTRPSTPSIPYSDVLIVHDQIPLRIKHKVELGCGVVAPCRRDDLAVFRSYEVPVGTEDEVDVVIELDDASIGLRGFDAD